MTPYDTVCAALDGAGYGPGVEERGGRRYRCPLHDDQHPSLFISEARDGAVMPFCRAGCIRGRGAARNPDLQRFTAAISLEFKDLFPPRQDHTPRSTSRSADKPRTIFKTANAAVRATWGCSPSSYWSYVNAEGEVIGIQCRLDRSDGTKTYLPVTKNCTGWSVGAMREPRPLYRLPDLAGAKRVVIVEGELCADALREIGFVATTSQGGSMAARKSDWNVLAGKHVLLLPDNDPPSTLR